MHSSAKYKADTAAKKADDVELTATDAKYHTDTEYDTKAESRCS